MESYQAIVQWLYAQVPVYQNQGVSAYKPDRQKMEDFVSYLGHPEKKFPTVHIAGTNGKGSTAHMVAAALQTAGHTTGLYTSPHLLDFSERIRLNGQPVLSLYVVEFVTRHREYFLTHQLSFFEITVGLAFSYFAEEEVDYAVIEVGLGGRLDATNVIDPVLSVITNIGFDHTAILGNTLAKIAREKAGIIKEKTPVIIGEYQQETFPVFEAIAQEKNAPLIKAEAISLPSNADTDLKGDYQKKNLQTAHAVVQHLLGDATRDDWIKGFRQVVKTTNLHGRWQQIATHPKTILDVSHNKEGFNYVIEQLQKERYDQIHLVLGFVKDKPLAELLALLPKKARYYLCAPNIPRALPIQDLCEQAGQYSLHFSAHSSVEQAYFKAQEEASPSDIILVTGSTFTVAEILQLKPL